MEVLKDKETWTEVANVLTEVLTADQNKFEELKGVERAYIQQETDRLLTIVALKIFPKYLEQMKRDLINPI